LEDLSNNTINSIANITVTRKDRNAISEYLTAFFNYQFEGMDSLKSFSVLRQII